MSISSDILNVKRKNCNLIKKSIYNKKLQNINKKKSTNIQLKKNYIKDYTRIDQSSENLQFGPAFTKGKDQLDVAFINLPIFLFSLFFQVIFHTFYKQKKIEILRILTVLFFIFLSTSCLLFISITIHHFPLKTNKRVTHFCNSSFIAAKTIFMSTKLALIVSDIQ